jgi:hypothetical protein
MRKFRKKNSKKKRKKKNIHDQREKEEGDYSILFIFYVTTILLDRWPTLHHRLHQTDTSTPHDLI